MADAKQAVIIKKYANRRLYNTGSSSYVTLEDLAQMVKAGDDFVVQDAKSGEDITHSVLTQIIFEQEGKEGQNLLPIDFLRQLIRFYGDSMQMLVPSYLQMSLEKFTGEQAKIREMMSAPFGAAGMPAKQMFDAMEEQTRKNMTLFTQALSAFPGFAPGGFGAPSAQEPPASKPEAPAAPAATPAPEAALDLMRQQLEMMQKKLEELSKKG